MSALSGRPSSPSPSTSLYTPRPYSKLSQEELHSRRKSFSPSSTFFSLPRQQKAGGDRMQRPHHPPPPPPLPVLPPPPLERRVKAAATDRAEKRSRPQSKEGGRQGHTSGREENGNDVSNEQHTSTATLDSGRPFARGRLTNTDGDRGKAWSRPRSASLERSSLRIRLVNNAPELNARGSSNSGRSSGDATLPKSRSLPRQSQQVERAEMDLNAAGKVDVPSTEKKPHAEEEPPKSLPSLGTAALLPPRAPPAAAGSSKSQTLPKQRRPLKGILRKPSTSEEEKFAEDSSTKEREEGGEEVFDGQDEENWPRGGRIRIPRLIGAGSGGARANRGLALRLFERIEADAERALPIRKTKSLSDVNLNADGDGRSKGIFAEYFERVAREKREAERREEKEEEQAARTKTEKVVVGKKDKKKKKKEEEKGEEELTSEEFVRRVLLGDEKERRPVRRQERKRRASASAATAAAILAWRSNHLPQPPHEGEEEEEEEEERRRRRNRHGRGKTEAHHHHSSDWTRRSGREGAREEVSSSPGIVLESYRLSALRSQYPRIFLYHTQNLT